MKAIQPRREEGRQQATFEAAPERLRRPRTFESLRDPNFRNFFAAQFGSFSAMNIQMFIRGWLVFELTGSYKALGIMSLANGLTGLVIAPLGGVIADRVRQKKHVVQLGQLVNVINALVIAALITAGELRFWHLVLAALIQGAAMSAMMPARQAMTPDVIGMTRLMNAIALNTSGMNVARLLMPGLAGFAVGWLGGGDGNVDPVKYVYFATAGLYLWAMLGLLRVTVPDKGRAGGDRAEGLVAFLLEEIRTGWHELKLGARYIVHTPVIRLLLLCNFLMVFFSMTYFMLLPGFAKDVLGAGPVGLGMLMSISGVGSLAGSLVVASLPNRHRGMILLLSALLLGVSLLAFSFSTHYWLSAGILVIVGVGQSGRMSISNALIQHNAEDAYRGRVMSIYMMEFSLMSVGIYAMGLLANSIDNFVGPGSGIGAQIAVGASAVGLIVLVTALLVFVPSYRNLE